MQEADKNNFKELMTGLGELYTKKIEKPLLRIYFNALEDLTIDEVSAAISMHIKSGDASSSFFPKPGDLIRQLQGTGKQQEQLVEDKAEMAWACIERDIRRIGSYGTLKLDDKQALAAVKSMGGWQSLCMSTYDQLVWKKKEFVRTYECFERTPLEALPASLPGRFELAEHKKEQSKGGMKSLMNGVNNYRKRIGKDDK